MKKEVLIRWKVRGCLNVNGHSHKRLAGEQDIVAIGRAKSLAACGMVEIVGDANEVPVVAAIPSEPEVAESVAMEPEPESEPEVEIEPEPEPEPENSEEFEPEESDTEEVAETLNSGSTERYEAEQGFDDEEEGDEE